MFGWQKQKQAPRTSSRRHATSSSSSSLTPTRTSSSPLRRSEHVFGWQQPQKRRASKSIDAKHKNRRASTNNPKAILHTTSSTQSTSIPVAEYKEEPPTTRTINNNQKQQQQQDQEMGPHQFNVHVGPRKKELWLPWPLGALRNDFYKFAAEQRTYGASNAIIINGAARQEWQPRNSRQQHQQQQEGHTNANGMLEQGRDWATKMLQRGGSLLPFPKLHANSDDNEQQQQQQRSSGGGGRTNGGMENKTMAGSSSSESSYWIKDTTTPMATASATMKKKGNGNKQMVSRGGESRVQDEESNKSMDDRDVLFEYLKLQARLRLRQLGYGKFCPIVPCTFFMQPLIGLCIIYCSYMRTK